MTEKSKKMTVRAGLAVILVSMAAGPAIAVTTGDGVPGWIVLGFFSGIVIAAVPGFVKTKVKSQ